MNEEKKEKEWIKAEDHPLEKKEAESFLEHVSMGETFMFSASLLTLTRDVNAEITGQLIGQKLGEEKAGGLLERIMKTASNNGIWDRNEWLPGLIKGLVRSGADRGIRGKEGKTALRHLVDIQKLLTPKKGVDKSLNDVFDVLAEGRGVDDLEIKEKLKDILEGRALDEKAGVWVEWNELNATAEKGRGKKQRSKL